jgi:hypothetical protein
MGLEGYRLWVMGQLDSTCRAPPRSDSIMSDAHAGPVHPFWGADRMQSTL